MRIGVIYCAWNTENMLDASLRPWIEARERRLGGHDYVICAVSVPFEGFADGREHDQTRSILVKELHELDGIDGGYFDDKPQKETEARGNALKWLIEEGVDVTIQVDSDEFYQLAEIERIFAFVGTRLVAAFKGSLKNYIGIPDDKTYLTEPFRPMRIHRVRYSSYQADSFWDDNNVLYRGTITRDFKRDVDLPVGQIPKTVAWVHHESWPNSMRSKRKIDYQLHGRKWPSCSFDWDDARGGLIWRDGQPIPETAHD